MSENWTIYFLIITFFVALIITMVGIFHWVANKENRSKRLKVVFCFAFIIFILFLLCIGRNFFYDILGQSREMNENFTPIIVNLLKIICKLVLAFLCILGVMLIAGVIIAAIAYAIKSIWRIFQSSKDGKTQELAEEMQKEIDELLLVLKNPVYALIVMVMIMFLFFLLPLLMGEKDETSLAECWKTGVIEIAGFCTDSNTENVEATDTAEENDKIADAGVKKDIDVGKENDANKEWNGEEDSRDNKFVKSLVIYILVYIVVLGVGYGIGNILFAIIHNRLQNSNNILTEYSNSIAIMAVGVSLLLLVYSGNIKFGENVPWAKQIINVINPFVSVIFLIVLIIITLEIVKLVIDLRQKLILKEARYLFVLIVGLCTIIIMKIFLMLYASISTVLGEGSGNPQNIENRIQEINKKIMKHVVEDMEEEIENSTEEKAMYSFFKERITKK